MRFPAFLIHQKKGKHKSILLYCLYFFSFFSVSISNFKVFISCCNPFVSNDNESILFFKIPTSFFKLKYPDLTLLNVSVISGYSAFVFLETIAVAKESFLLLLLSFF